MPAGEKIRVLIVDDVSETRENVKKLLQTRKNTLASEPTTAYLVV